MRAAAIAFAVIVVGLGAPAAVAAVAAGWSAAMAVSPSGLPGGQAVYPPQVGIDAHGDAIAAWDEQIRCGPPRLTVAVRRAGRLGWGADLVLAPAGTGSFDPALAVAPSGAAVVVWQSSSAHCMDYSGYSVILASVRDPRTGGWSAPTQISPRRPWDVTSPKVAINNRGQAIAGWAELTPATDHNQVASFDPATGIWSAPVTLPSLPRPRPPAVAIDDRGDIAVVWDDRVRFHGINIPGVASATAKVSAAVRPAGARRWIVTRTLGASAYPPGQFELTIEQPAPQIAIDAAGDALAVWQGGTVGQPVTDTAVWNARTRRWSRPAPVARSGAAWPHVAVTPQGQATVVWLGPGGSVLAASRPILGCCFTKPAILLARSKLVSHPQVAVSQTGEAIAIWSAEPLKAAVRYPLQAVVRDPRTGRWQRAVSLGHSTDPFGLAAGGAVALNGAGQGIVAWPEDINAPPPSSTTSSTQPPTHRDPSGSSCWTTCGDARSHVLGQKRDRMTAARAWLWANVTGTHESCPAWSPSRRPFAGVRAGERPPFASTVLHHRHK